MKKPVTLIELTIWDENTDSPYVTRDELKAIFDPSDYLVLLKFVLNKKISCRMEWLDIKVISEFLKINR